MWRPEGKVIEKFVIRKFCISYDLCLSNLLKITDSYIIFSGGKWDKISKKLIEQHCKIWTLQTDPKVALGLIIIAMITQGSQNLITAPPMFWPQAITDYTKSNPSFRQGTMFLLDTSGTWAKALKVLATGYCWLPSMVLGKVLDLV